MASGEGSGFVYATTGAAYTTLARRSARNLRQAMPKAQIDLFTDQVIADDIFDRIIPLNQSWVRPKMEAIRRSRFARSVILDADTIVLSDIAELFGMVDQWELAGCLAMGRPPDLFDAQADIPRAFPYLNSGVLVVRRSRAIHDFALMWEEMIRREGMTVDQYALRRLLYDLGLPFMVLPPEYNLIHLAQLDIWETRFGLPKILHITALHNAPAGAAEQPFDVAALVGPARMTVLAGANGPLSAMEQARRQADGPPSPPRSGLRRLLPR